MRPAAILAAVLMAIGALAATPAGASKTPQVLFECKDADWSVRLLGTGDGKLVLITSRLSGPPSTAGVTSSWREVREGRVTGQEGGHQSHLRLHDGYRQIILFEGRSGNLSDNPGETHAGAMTFTQRNPAQDLRVTCEADETNAKLVENTVKWAEQTGGPVPQPEDEGGEFDAWF
ncbi:hypothetical protein [Paraurantiacibacter namhicola]|uniref:Uncharacterized protein n=1 Tax=Paraurantiacibacter namhicola TaxID=645517 RepID=A0A1C7D4W0_9SPHN|nr:hypothetical protein [Paraurantiacibacter namhicola]ANU06500.1 hypothetical protein A6F65_00173 [Paraurantiacibacter namhicola]